MNILVTGANGQLGLSLRERAAGHRFVFTDVVDLPGYETEHLDITSRDAIRALVEERQIDAIVNCAAYTNVDAAEDHPDLAELLNATAVENLAVVMQERGGLLVHISTDYVFGAEPYNTPCREDQQGTPTGVYGLTKLHGEQAILRSGVRHIILRTAWLYSEYGKNFVKTMLALTSQKPSLQVVFDQAGTPTYAGDLAAAILAVLAHPVEGIFHYSNEGVCSWYDFTKMIAAYAGHTACDIRPCHSSEFPSKVRRPAYSVLDKTKIKATYGLSIPYWTDSLQTCIKNLTK
ncbi:MAG: dTDP-4-dehydrorhamnose reductase [Bacteroidales bacterium]|nr:dTDP-4-dehydrorhamnose reductase [Bacteroidales bacterium]